MIKVKAYEDLVGRNLNKDFINNISERFDLSVEHSNLFCYTEEEYRKQLTILIVTYYSAIESIEPIDYINAFGHIVKTFVRSSDGDIEVSIYKSDYEDGDDPIGGGVCEMEEIFDTTSRTDIKDKVDFLIELSETY